MRRIMLKSKIHGATVTDAHLEYEGSITLDHELLCAANILPGEQVHVLNRDTGSRFVTYIIAAEAGSGTVVLNGPAARLGQPGDTILVLSYAPYDETEARSHEPVVIRVDAQNRLLPGSP